MYKVQTYDRARTIVYNPAANRRLLTFDTQILGNTITQIAGQKLVRAGAILATDGKLLKRSKVLTASAIGDTTIYVNNPWAFTVGDALKIIAPPNTPASAELAAITGGTGAVVGTIASIEAGTATQISRISLSAPVVGNIVTVNFYGLTVVYQIATAVLADELINLASAIADRLATVDQYRYVSATATSTYVEIKSTQPRSIVEFIAILSQGVAATLGGINTSTSQGIGAITLAAPLAIAIAQGTKIGTTTQIPLGIFDTEFDFGDYLHGIAPEQAITPLYGGQFYSQSPPYLDGQVLSNLNQAAWIPAIA
jgi:hypothetical protein